MIEQTPFSALQAEQDRQTRLKQATRKIVASVPVKKSRFATVNLTGAAQYSLFIGGLVSLTVGCGMIYLPLGPVVGGIIAVSLGMLLSTETK